MSPSTSRGKASVAKRAETFGLSRQLQRVVNPKFLAPPHARTPQPSALPWHSARARTDYTATPAAANTARWYALAVASWVHGGCCCPRIRRDTRVRVAISLRRVFKL